MLSKELIYNSGAGFLTLITKLLSSRSFWALAALSTAGYLTIAPVAQKWDREATAWGFGGLAATLPIAWWLSKDMEYEVSLLSVNRRLGYEYQSGEMVHELNRIRATYAKEIQAITGHSGDPEQLMAQMLDYLPSGLPGSVSDGMETAIAPVTPITQALAKYGVATAEIGSMQSPYFTRHVLELLPDGKGKPPKVKDVEALSREIQISLKIDDEPLISVSRDGLMVDIPLPKDQRQAIAAEALIKPGAMTHIDDFAVSLGVGIDGQLYTLNFSDSQTPHALVGGTTGSGKTEFLRTLLYSALSWYPPDVAMLAIADPKRVSFNDFADYSGMLAPISKTPDDTLILVESLVGEMETRFEQFEAAKVVDIKQFNADNPSPMARILFLLDEYSELADQCDDDQFKRIETGLRRLTQKARAAGIHVVIATQKPIAKTNQNPRGLDTVLRSNLPASIALKVRNASDSGVVLGEPGAEKLLGKGDMLVMLSSDPERLQSPLITSKTSIAQAIARHGSNSFMSPTPPAPPLPKTQPRQQQKPPARPIIDVESTVIEDRQRLDNLFKINAADFPSDELAESFFAPPGNGSLFDKSDRDYWLEKLCQYLKQKRTITLRNLKKNWGTSKGFSSAEVDDFLTELEQMGMIAVRDGSITYEGT